MAFDVVDAVKGITTKVDDIGTSQVSLEEKIETYEKNAEECDKVLKGLETKLTHEEAQRAGLEADIRTLMQRGSAGTTPVDDGKPIPKDQWSWSRFCYATATKDWESAPFELSEVKKFREEVKRKADAMQAVDFSAGGSLIPTQYVADLIGLLRPQLITEALGVPVLTGLVGSPVMWPKVTTGSSGGWIAPEGSSIPSEKLVTGALQMTPKKGATIIKLSNDLVLLSNPAVEAIVRADITASLAQLVDVAFFQGTGTTGQPTGLSNWAPAIPSTDFSDWNGGSDLVRLNLLKSMTKTVASNNGLFGQLAFATNINGWFEMDALVDGNSRPYLQPNPAGAQTGGILRGTISGYPVVGGVNVSPAGATGDLAFFGNWANTILAVWSSMEISSTTDSDTAFQQDELWIRALLRVDTGVRQENSFTVSSDDLDA